MENLEELQALLRIIDSPLAKVAVLDAVEVEEMDFKGLWKTSEGFIVEVEGWNGTIWHGEVKKNSFNLSRGAYCAFDRRGYSGAVGKLMERRRGEEAGFEY